jgi:hypothetical protein
MNGFSRFFRRKSIVHIAIAWTLVAAVPATQAETATHLDKHAHKIEKRLAKYHPGSLLQIDLRDNTQTLGSLGALSDATFQLTNADSNKTMTISYADVVQVKKGKQYVDAGAGHSFHVRPVVLVVIGAVAVGTAVALVEF